MSIYGCPVDIRTAFFITAAPQKIKATYNLNESFSLNILAYVLKDSILIYKRI